MQLFEAFDVGTFCRNVPIRYGKYSVTGLTRLTAPGRRFICPIIDATASGDHFFELFQRFLPALELYSSRFMRCFREVEAPTRTSGRLRKSRPRVGIVSRVSETRQAAMRNQIQTELGLTHHIVRATVGVVTLRRRLASASTCRGSRGRRLRGLYGLPSRQPWRSAASLAKSAKETLPSSDKSTLTKFFG